jgi:xanthomonalisin
MNSFAATHAASTHTVLASAGIKSAQLPGKVHVPEAVSNGTAKLVSHAEPDQVYELAIALPVRNEAALDQLRADQHDKNSPSYHKWITVNQFADQFAPSPAEYAKVVKYLQSKGFTITVQHANRLAVSFTGTTEQIERAFHVTMNNYQHPTEDRTFYAPDREPTLPGLTVPTLLIAGLDNYVLPHSHLRRNPHATPKAISHASTLSCYGPPYSVNVGTGGCGTYAPSDLRAAYYGGTALTGAGQQIGILGFGGAATSDVTLQAGYENQTVPTVNYLLGSACTKRCTSDGEQVLDIIYSSGMAPGATINFFSNSSNDLTIINAMASSTVSSVYTSSWGWTSKNYTAEDTDYKEMQTQGQIYLNATGDDGAYNTTIWDFPSGDPYITDVGGTQLITNGAGGSWNSELAWPYSSGGVAPASDVVYTIPSWQTGAVNSSNGISASYRSDPDISAEADYEMLGCEGGTCEDTYGGTSYAAPQWAGFFAMVNQASVAAGNGVLGFPNYELYAAGESSLFSSNFHDITACGGVDAGEETGPDCNSPDEGTKTQGYNPVAGFDDVTGWGSPNGIGLIDALSIPTLQISAAPYTNVSSIVFTANFPEFDGTATFTAKSSGGTTATIGTCTVSNGTCSTTILGSAIGTGTFTIQAVYQETTSSTKKYSATQQITINTAITFTSVSHNFGTVAVGTAATAYTLAVKNTSTTTAFPFSLNFTAANGFTSATNCPSSIAAGGTCELAFYFTPTQTATVTDTWTLASQTNFAFAPSNGGTLTGGGTSAGGLALTTAGHNWGTVPVGTTSAAYGATLSNSTSSAVALTLGSVTSPFAALTNCGATLAAGASCQFQFTFTPTSTSTVSQTYSISAGGVTITSGGNTVTGIVLTGN